MENQGVHVYSDDIQKTIFTKKSSGDQLKLTETYIASMNGGEETGGSRGRRRKWLGMCAL